MATTLTRYVINDADRSLIEGFRKKPIGPHPPALMRLLNRMRGADVEGKHVLLNLASHERWVVAEMQGRGKPPKPLGIEVTSVAEGEWQIFKLRWQRLTGERLAD